uniref:Uncharacterized protein n=1 Tax=Chlamydomonas leiostraca TaxID=1034604 RepID=A0A7S0WM97_9CHLO
MDGWHGGDVHHHLTGLGVAALSTLSPVVYAPTQAVAEAEEGAEGLPYCLPYCRHDEQHDHRTMVPRLEGVTHVDGKPLFRVASHAATPHVLHLPHPAAHALLDAVLRQAGPASNHDHVMHAANSGQDGHSHATHLYHHHQVAADAYANAGARGATWPNFGSAAGAQQQRQHPTLLQAAQQRGLSGGVGAAAGCVGGLASVRAHLAASSSHRRELLAQLEALVAAHGARDAHGCVALPLVTRMYTLVPIN